VYGSSNSISYLQNLDVRFAIQERQFVSPKP